MGELETDIRSSLSSILLTQRDADPEAYQAARAKFTGEEGGILLDAPFGTAAVN